MRRTLALTFSLTSLLALAFVPLYAAPATTAAPASPPITLEAGTISGAHFTIARPQFWNNRVLLLAHGYRAEDRPLLADLFPEHLAYRTLLDEDWMIAKTSYRRNGMIVADAIPGTWFELTARDQKFRVRHGTDFTSVKKGEWVIFPSADGFYWLARNHGDAAATATLKLGDTLTLRRYDDPQ